MDSTRNERSSVLAKYFSEIRKYPLLSKEQEQTLAGRVLGGSREALHELIEANLSLRLVIAGRTLFGG